MLLPSWLSSIAFVVFIRSGTAISRKELEKKDLVCTENDALLSFQEYTEDSVPFCSTYLFIPLSTSTVSVTGRTSAYPSPVTMPIC